ncbi:MAG: PAAR domain-containing protein [Polyangiaceae bacterium]|nr:PAAR domain-containing protein [Polyangiaceae bacterium]
MSLKPAARKTDVHVCNAHGGGPITTGSSSVEICDQSAARLTDKAKCPGPINFIVEGSGTVFINDLPAARMGDAVAHGGIVAIGCLFVLIGGPTIGSLGTFPPPEEIIISPELCKQFNELWGKSFPGGKSQEFGGTLVKDQAGNVSMINTGGGNSGSFSPDLNVPAGYEVLGAFHTHPYDATEGGHTNVSLSGGDAGYMINNGHPLIIAQSGEGQYAYFKTDKTPTNVDYSKLNADQNARVSALMGEGKSFDEASRIAAKETADTYGLSYYEGKDCKLKRAN